MPAMRILCFLALFICSFGNRFLALPGGGKPLSLFNYNFGRGCSYVATTKYVFSLDIQRNILEEYTVPNLIAFPDRQPVVAALFDDRRSNGVILALGDDTGGISFSRSASCNASFTQDFDLYLNFTGPWLSVAKTNNVTSFISATKKVDIGWVNGVDGLTLGVLRVLSFQNALDNPISGVIQGPSGPVIVTQRYVDVLNRTAIGSQTRMGSGTQSDENYYLSGAASFELQTPILGSAWGGAILGISNAGINGGPGLLVVYPGDTVPKTAAISEMEVDHQSYAHAWSYSMAVSSQGIWEEEYLSAFVFASSSDGNNIPELYKVQLYMPQKYSIFVSTRVLSRLSANEAKGYFIPTNRSIYVEQSLSRGQEIGAVSTLLENSEGGSAVLDIYLTKDYAPSAKVNSAFYTDCDVFNPLCKMPSPTCSIVNNHGGWGPECI